MNLSFLYRICVQLDALVILEGFNIFQGSIWCLQNKFQLVLSYVKNVLISNLKSVWPETFKNYELLMIYC